MSSMDDLAARMYGGQELERPTLVGSTAAPDSDKPAQARTDDELAAALYGTTPPAKVAVAPATQRSPEELGEAQYTKEALPAAEEPADPDMKALRDDPLRKLYGGDVERALPEQEFLALAGNKVEIDGQTIEMTPELARKGVAELRAMASDLSLTQSEVSNVRAAFAFADSIKGDAEKIAAAQTAAGERLNAEHGSDAALAFRAARAYVAKNPRLAVVLERSGAGNSPEVVATIARKALALHKGGRLKLG